MEKGKIVEEKGKIVEEKSVKDFFSGLVARKMAKIGFYEEGVAIFLSELMVLYMSVNQAQLAAVLENKLVVMSVFETDPEWLEETSRSLLLLLGLFPERLSNLYNRRAIGLSDYLAIEKLVIARLAQRGGIWKEVQNHFTEVIMVLNGLRQDLGLKTDMAVSVELAQEIKNK